MVTMDTSTTPPHLVKNTIGGVVGNILEWYDFAVFGYFASIIGAQFFPAEDQLASLINAFGVFAAGYLMRPLGGMIFGYIGDKLGRKKALRLSIIMMAIATTVLGLLPTHAQVGTLAAFLLVLLRLLQGISVGGELIGSISFITEIAPPERRGFFGSWTLFSAIGGVMLGSAVATITHSLLDQETLHRWGWRLPFLSGFLIGGFGLWMRKGLQESPEFERLQQSNDVERNPVKEAIRTMPTQILLVGGLVLLMGTGFYILFVWWPTYLTKIVTPTVDHALLVNTLSMLLMMLLIPFAGYISDKIGRVKTLGIATLFFVVASWPLFVLTDTATFTAALIAQLCFAVMMAFVQGPMAATMVEMFPVRNRFSGIAIGYNFSLALFGGTAPLVCTWLIEKTGDTAAPAYYLTGLAVLSLLALLILRSRKKNEYKTR